jgi:hypothetical protein
MDNRLFAAMHSGEDDLTKLHRRIKLSLCDRCVTHLEWFGDHIITGYNDDFWCSRCLPKVKAFKQEIKNLP